jgi:hypothetical protein
VNFYTIGLPRSKSLWLSHLLRSDNADCYHEGLTIGNELPPTKKRYIGSCDNNLFNITERSPLAVIIRDPYEVIDSMERNFDNPFDRPFRPFLEGWIGKAYGILVNLPGKKFRFEDLNNIDCLKEMISFLKPDDVPSEYELIYMTVTRIETTIRTIADGMRVMAAQVGVPYSELYDYITR